MATPVRTHLFRGKRYRIVYVPYMKKVDGQCSNPKYKNRKITIDASLRGLRELEVLIHEMTHAGLYDLDEHAVTEMAHDVATLLWRLGYRKNPKAS